MTSNTIRSDQHVWPGFGAIIGAVVLGLGVVLLGACSEPQSSVQEHLQRASAYRASGDTEAAIIELKNALQIDQNLGRARLLLGEFYVEAGNGAAAEKELRRARSLGIDEKLVLQPLARAYLLQGQPERVVEEISVPEGIAASAAAAIHVLHGRAHLALQDQVRAKQSFDKALSLQPGLADALVGLAYHSVRAADKAQARKLLNEAIASDSRFAEAWGLLADLEQVEGNSDAAETAYSNALDIAPGNVAILYKRAMLRMSLRKFDAAEQDVAELRKRAPKSALTHYVTGLSHIYAQRYKQAQTALEEALKYQEQLLPAVLALGQVHVALGNNAQAEEYLSRYLRSVPDSQRARKLLALTKLRTRDLSAAQSLLEPLVGTDAADALALNLLGSIYVAQGKAEQGIKHLEKAVDLQPDTAVSRFSLGMGLLGSGDVAAGIEELEKAVAMEPELRTAEIALVVSYLKAGQYDQALAAIDRLESQEPGSVRPQNLRAVVYLNKGDTATAQGILREILNKSPGEPIASHNLAVVALRNGQTNEAVALYRTAYEHYPNDLGTILRLAFLQLRRGNQAESVSLLKDAVNRMPKAWQPRVMLARYLLAAGGYQDAVDLTEKGLVWDKSNRALLMVNGEALLMTRQPDKAAARFQELAETQPKSAQAQYLLARAYGQMGNSEKTSAALSQALELDPKHMGALLAVSRQHMLGGNAAKAEAVLAKLKSLYPDHPAVMMQEGWVALREKRLPEAVAAYQRAYDKLPSRDGAAGLAGAKWMSGDRAGGAAVLDEWTSRSPNDVVSLERLAQMYLALGEGKRAATTYERVVERQPNNPVALNNLAWLTRAEDIDKAISYAERALTYAPGRGEIMDSLGALLLEKGDVSRALELLQEAHRKLPQNPTVGYHLAQALVASDEKGRARELLTTVLSESGQFPEREEAERLRREL